MTTTYAILATVSLRHDYYADGRCPDFQIRPSGATAEAMRGLCILTRMIGDTLVLLLKVDEAGKAYLSLPPDIKLSFYLELIQTDFLNYSNAPVANGKICYCSNIPHTKLGDTRYLNSPLPAFNLATAYAVGDLVADGGNAFEAIRPVAPGSHPTSDDDFWQMRQSNQYLHPGDLLLLTDGVQRFSVAPANHFTIEVFGLNPLSRLFDLPIETQEIHFPSSVAELLLSLQHLAPAKYRVAVNGVDYFMYVDSTACYARVFGILELFNFYPAADDFGWLQPDQSPKGLDYVIRFANRLAIWKYIARTTNVTAVENTSVPNAFEPGDQPRQFVSRKPLFLQQQPVKTLRVMSGATVLASRLANPPPDRIATTIEDGIEYFCAEMYLNY